MQKKLTSGGVHNSDETILNHLIADESHIHPQRSDTWCRTGKVELENFFRCYRLLSTWLMCSSIIGTRSEDSCVCGKWWWAGQRCNAARGTIFNNFGQACVPMLTEIQAHGQNMVDSLSCGGDICKRGIWATLGMYGGGWKGGRCPEFGDVLRNSFGCAREHQHDLFVDSTCTRGNSHR